MLGRRWYLDLALLAAVLCPAIFGQSTSSETAKPAEDSGLRVIKSRWYRHVVMLTVPPWSASSGSANAGLPTGIFVGNRRGFMYEAKVKNESGRDVKAVHWDHVFLDPKGGEEMRRFHFASDRRSIGKGKTITLQRMSGHPPSGTIDASMLEKDAAPYVERIDIKCVLYKDDSLWIAPNASRAECGHMRRFMKRPSK